MGLTIDPLGLETHVIHDLIDFNEKDVLEIGCGDGRMTRRFAEHTASVTALDPDEAMIAAAKVNFPDALRLGISFRVADITVVDLPESNYDVAVFSGSI
jgi:ubiquinone/menaquinone biosynthesis C-methylase UbiE